MNITLIAEEGTSGVAGEVFIGGSPDLPRAEWLGRIGEIAELVAAECHSNDVSPTVRVGGAAKGYASLKTSSGVTDFGHVIRFFPWDVFAGQLQRAYEVSAVEEEPVHATLVSEVHEIDGDVEKAALEGDDEALTKVIGVAATDPEHAEHAKEVLAQVPHENLEAWNRVHGE